jgi:tRNA threonylcarbamoyladenosine biosynthesis protein TsaE
MSQPHSTELDIVLPDRTATRRFAIRLAGAVKRGDVIALGGALGAGKTTLARDLIEAIAGKPSEVPSPTFTLVQTYELDPVTVWHFDLYRVARPEEVLELGIEDALAEGVTLIEWPERMAPLLPDDRLDIVLEQGATPDARRVRITAHGSWRARLEAVADDPVRQGA